MANIVIKELYDSDNILTLTEKINQNFDQLLLAGGGPIGPQGVQGIQGIAGSQGIRGSQWVAGLGATTINLPTDNQYRENDFLLDDGGSFVGGATGQVWYYNSSGVWTDTGINLVGPQGIQGPTGDSGIQIIPGKFSPSNNNWIPDETDLGDYITFSIPADDKDDTYVGGIAQLTSLDFITLGRGNNSLVLGRYATLFDTGTTTSQEYIPPTNGIDTNIRIIDWPLESDVPMLVIAQNDYKTPGATNASFSNGIAIGLNMSHFYGTYNSNFPYYNNGNFNYASHFANISIENRLLDFKIKGTDIGNTTITSADASLKLGSGGNNPLRANVHSISTKLDSTVYTEFDIQNDFDIKVDDGLFARADFSYFENKRRYIPNGGSDIRGNTSRSFFTANDIDSINSSNEIILINNTTLSTTTGSGINLDKIQNSFNSSIELNPNEKSYPFKIGQTAINIDVENSSYADVNLNITYQGLGYDQNLITYTTDPSKVAVTSDLNTIGRNSYKGVITNDTNDNTFLYGAGFGKDITSVLVPGGISMSRIIFRPGFFRDGGTSKDNTFDKAHKIMPTGSLDLYGTVRLREQGLTNDGAKDGYIATNAKDGIVKWEPASSINAVPTGAVIMFSEMSSDKFSFLANTSKLYGDKNSGSPYDAESGYWNPGGTAFIGAAFIGKGSGDLKDYYICNGAVLADSRDCWITGPYSKIQGIVAVDGNGTTNIDQTKWQTDWSKWSNNPDFVSKPGAPTYYPEKWFTQVNGTSVSSSPGAPFAQATHRDFLNSNSLINTPRRTIFGYSIPGPSLLESGFRVVLPNYFGRFPKMIFPDSDALSRIFSYAPSDMDYTGHNFLTLTSSVYNDKAPMKTSFQHLGSPYILYNQLPDTSHTHNVPLVDIGEHDHGGFTNNGTNDGAHVHTKLSIRTHENISGSYVINHISRSGTNADPFDIGSNGNYYAKSDGSDHRHIIGGQTLTVPAHVTESAKAVQSTQITKYYGANLNANWLRTDDGQRFFSPPFLGTYFAINLKGLKNPLRNNTTIQDLHYIAGVPIMGPGGFSNDWSWYSTTENPTQYIKDYGNNGWFDTWYKENSTTYVKYGYETRLFEYNFRAIQSNDVTMHPYTVKNNSRTGGALYNSKKTNPKSSSSDFNISNFDYTIYP
jgi:hypothetical protein